MILQLGVADVIMRGVHSAQTTAAQGYWLPVCRCVLRNLYSCASCFSTWWFLSGLLAAFSTRLAYLSNMQHKPMLKAYKYRIYPNDVRLATVANFCTNLYIYNIVWLQSS